MIAFGGLQMTAEEKKDFGDKTAQQVVPAGISMRSSQRRAAAPAQHLQE